MRFSFNEQDTYYNKTNVTNSNLEHRDHALVEGADINFLTNAS